MGSRAVPGWEPPTLVTLPPAPSGETSASTPDVTSSTAATPSTTPTKRSPCGSALTLTSTPWPSRPSCTSKLSTLDTQHYYISAGQNIMTWNSSRITITPQPALHSSALLACLGMLVSTINPRAYKDYYCEHERLCLLVVCQNAGKKERQN